MANRAVALVGAATAALVLALLLAALVPLLAYIGQGTPAPSLWAALRFTLVQAMLSALISALAGAVLARALFRRQFWGKAWLISLLSAPFLLPSLAAVMGLLVIFGRNGVVNAGLGAIGLPSLSIFGLGGVVLAHVFLNLPLAARMVLGAWAGIPVRRLHVAQSLGFGPAAVFWHLEWPMLRSVLPSVISAVFLICLGSFAVALILGGGPRASTVELAMYQAIRFEFDLPRAAQMALLQLALGAGAVLVAALAYRPAAFGAGLDADAGTVWAGGHGWGHRLDGAVIIGAVLFLLAPLVALVALGGTGVGLLPAGFWSAAARSVCIAMAAAGLATMAALALAWARAKGAGLAVELVAMAPLGLSSLTLATGAFMALRPWTAPQNFAIPLAILLGAVLALPFLFRILLPPCRDIAAQYGRLSVQVGLSPWAEWRLVAWPRLSRPVGFSMGLAAAMGMGEFGVLALFGAPHQATLPMLVARLMGSYQMQAAAVVTLGLVALSFALFWLFDIWGARHAAT